MSDFDQNKFESLSSTYFESGDFNATLITELIFANPDEEGNINLFEVLDAWVSNSNTIPSFVNDGDDEIITLKLKHFSSDVVISKNTTLPIELLLNDERFRNVVQRILRRIERLFGKQGIQALLSSSENLPQASSQRRFKGDSPEEFQNLKIQSELKALEFVKSLPPSSEPSSTSPTASSYETPKRASLSTSLIKNCLVGPSGESSSDEDTLEPLIEGKKHHGHHQHHQRGQSSGSDDGVIDV